MAKPNFKNLTLFHGDNLDFLRGMNSESVHLIATDPPFNKNKDFHAAPDSLAAGAAFQDRWSWIDDIHDNWLIQIQSGEPEVWSVITVAKMAYGYDMAASLIGSLPTLFIFIFFQRYFIKGLTLGAVKG